MRQKLKEFLTRNKYNNKSGLMAGNRHFIKKDNPYSNKIFINN